jgi:hypothetical protein
MAIICPKCGAEFDATLFEFGHGVRCDCGMEIEYPGTALRAGHVAKDGHGPSHEDRCLGCLLGTACGDIIGAAVEGSSARDSHFKVLATSPDPSAQASVAAEGAEPDAIAHQ